MLCKPLERDLSGRKNGVVGKCFDPSDNQSTDQAQVDGLGLSHNTML